MPTFKYLGATSTENGDLGAELYAAYNTIGIENVEDRVSGVLCDRRISCDVRCRDMGSEDITIR